MLPSVPSNSQCAPVPEGCGLAIPNSANDLLRFIQSQKNKKSSASTSSLKLNNSAVFSNNVADRQKRQEAERQSYERRLMELEDLTNSEATSHLKIAEERLLMCERLFFPSSPLETEDAQSVMLKAVFKEYDQQRFREKIRLEVEERKAKELAEKEERRKAAEARRAAVVERIRKQAELEERRKREAEEALQRIEEEKVRRERAALERHLTDQAQMTIEDNLSALAEQDFRELLERKLWKQREREKLLEWEREQQKKDQLEEEQRKLRLAELEEKRKKLEQLRQMQQAGDSKANEEKLREEGNRINKQLRIQNRAKFVSKKMRATDSANSAELKANASAAMIVEPPKPTAEADVQNVGETPAVVRPLIVDPAPGQQ
eukprot:scaffold208_cov149-Ochromonas_danica.AAC.3